MIPGPSRRHHALHQPDEEGHPTLPRFTLLSVAGRRSTGSSRAQLLTVERHTLTRARGDTVPPRKPTPRTATTKWKNLRVKVLRRDQRNGVTYCPECGIKLDYKQAGRRNSAEVDHVLPVAQGGTDAFSNLRVCCRRCNQSLGAKITKRPAAKLDITLPGWSQDADNW